jgi:hypothetical protein
MRSPSIATEPPKMSFEAASPATSFACSIQPKGARTNTYAAPAPTRPLGLAPGAPTTAVLPEIATR